MREYSSRNRTAIEESYEGKGLLPFLRLRYILKTGVAEAWMLNEFVDIND